MPMPLRPRCGRAGVGDLRHCLGPRPRCCTWVRGICEQGHVGRPRRGSRGSLVVRASTEPALSSDVERSAMEVTVVVVAAGALFAWGLLSNRLERADLTAPIAFIGVGAALAAFDLVHGPSGPESLTPLVEVTLVWVLFSDAAR